MKKIFFILVLFLFLSTIDTFSQPYYFRSYQVEKGLSNNTVTCSLQDKKGFMWFGTKDGLNRFDGVNFKVFRNNITDNNSLGNNSIIKLFEDGNGTLWIGTERGLYCYNEEKENFTLLKNSLPAEIEGIEADNNGNLWFIAKLRLFKYIKANKKIIEYSSNNIVYYTSICKDKKGNIWISSGNGYIGKYNVQTMSFNFYFLFNHSKPTASNYIEKIFDSEDGYLLIGTTNQGVKRFDVNHHTYSDILTYNNDGTEIFVRDFIKNSKDEYWIATESGIYIYNTRTKKYINLKKNYNSPYSLTDNAIYCFSKDKEGGIWIGTYFGGINYYSRQNIIFKKYFPRIGENAISGNAVREIVQDKKGNLWIGTEDAGLNKFNPLTGSFKNFKPDNSSQNISHTNIHGLLIDNHILWIGTFEHGLDKMDLNTEKVIKHYIAGPAENELKSNFIYSIYKTKSNQIFLATSNGLYSYNRKNDDFHLIKFLPFNTFYSAILEDTYGTMWVGTFNAGVYYFNSAKHVHGYLKINEEDALAKTRITKLYEDSQNNLWISTENKLYCYNLSNHSLNILSDKTGLPSNLIYNTLEDNKENLYITTSKGLVRYNLKNKSINIFTQANGLLNDQFNYSSGFIDKTGKMYFGSVKGMISFNPDEFYTSNYIPPVYFTNIQIFNKEIEINGQGSPLSKSILLTKSIALPYNQATFCIDFAALTFSSPSIVQYAYKITGIDNDWNYIKNNHRVYFTNLQPGNYTLLVKSTNSNGIWVSNTIALDIKILPPWWKSILAYLIYSLIILLIGYSIFRFYHNKQLSKQKRQMELFEIKKEKEFYQSKMDFFTKIAHEIRTPLTLIKAPMEKILKQAGSFPQLNKYLLLMNKNTDRLLTLTNQLLDFRKVESDRFLINPSHLNITELTKNICTNFQPIAEQKNMQLYFTGEEDAVFADVDEEATTKIINNLLDNAIKYGKSKIIIEILPPKDNNKYITITVSNDGYIIPESFYDKVFEPFFRLKETDRASGTGIGLSLARSLAQLQKGNLTLTANNNINTFILTFPIL